MTVGLDRRAAASDTRCSGQVLMPPVQAIEHAHDDKRRTMLGHELVDAMDDLHRRHASASTTPTSIVAGAWPAVPAGWTKTLSGARRPAVAVAMATRPPSGPTRR